MSNFQDYINSATIQSHYIPRRSKMNYISLVLGLIAMVALGMLWYSKLLFGRQWLALQKFVDAKPAPSTKALALSIIMNLIITAAVNWLVIQNNLNLLGAVELALFIWIGFLVPFHAQNIIHGKQPFKLFAIISGYQLVGLLIVSLISAALLR